MHLTHLYRCKMIAGHDLPQSFGWSAGLSCKVFLENMTSKAIWYYRKWITNIMAGNTMRNLCKQTWIIAGHVYKNLFARTLRTQMSGRDGLSISKNLDDPCGCEYQRLTDWISRREDHISTVKEKNSACLLTFTEKVSVKFLLFSG